MGEYCEVSHLKYYLPLRTETKIYQRRKVTVEKPIFPGYFFASFDADGRLNLLKSNIVIRVLEPGNQRELLHQLAQIRKALAVDPTLGACAAFQKGRRVRILSGPFTGVEGVVSQLKGNTRVWLNVEIIGRAVAVEVGRESLEPVD